MNRNLFRNTGVEINLVSDDNFLKVKETLTRMGIASKTEKTLYQSCHILHKKDRETGKSRYSILHFKELFILDGKRNTLEEEDIARRNTIVNLLEEWGLVIIKDTDGATDPVASLSKIKIISHKEKKDWQLNSKYNIGIKKGDII